MKPQTMSASSIQDLTDSATADSNDVSNGKPTMASRAVHLRRLLPGSRIVDFHGFRTGSILGDQITDSSKES